MEPCKTRSRVERACAVLTVVSALTSAGFSLAALPTGDLYARYSVARSVPLAFVALLVAARPSRGAVITIALVMSLVQGGDAVIGALSSDLVKTLGPIFLAFMNLGSLAMLLRRGESSG